MILPENPQKNAKNRLTRRGGSGIICRLSRRRGPGKGPKRSAGRSLKIEQQTRKYKHASARKIGQYQKRKQTLQKSRSEK